MGGSGSKDKEKEEKKGKNTESKKQKNPAAGPSRERKTSDGGDQRKISDGDKKPDSAKRQESRESKGDQPKPRRTSESRTAPQKASIKKKGGKHRRQKKGQIKVDLSKPLSWPAEPELVLEYHKNKSFLTPNEEWMLVELNEFECLVDNKEILTIMARHSKYTEMDPPEYLEEFFEFVDDIPTYDEIINYDVWQEFRDIKYPC